VYSHKSEPVIYIKKEIKKNTGCYVLLWFGMDITTGRVRKVRTVTSKVFPVFPVFPERTDFSKVEIYRLVSTHPVEKLLKSCG